jgi:nitrogenase molybdenum-iron protein alpha chain
MKSRVKEGTLILDDPNSLEFEEIINEYKPDLILAGVKEKYLAHKLGVPCILIHSYENGPYMGFEGFVNLAKDMYSNIYSPVWNMVEYKDESVEDTYNIELENNSETEEHDNRAKNAEEMA